MKITTQKQARLSCGTDSGRENCPLILGRSVAREDDPDIDPARLAMPGLHDIAGEAHADYAAALAFALARALGARPLFRVLAAFAVLLVPKAFEQAASANVDLIAGFWGALAAWLLARRQRGFAALALHFARHMGVEPDRLNVNGGAIALGHAMGSTGGALIGTALDELERRDGKRALIAACGAAGLAAAVIIERVA